MSDEPNILYRREGNGEDGTPIEVREWADALDLVLGEPLIDGLVDGRVAELSKLDAAALGGVLTRWAES